jgi:hypothetical protein
MLIFTRSLKNLKFLQNVWQRYTIIPTFLGNFKAIRSVCFCSGGIVFYITSQVKWFLLANGGYN